VVQNDSYNRKGGGEKEKRKGEEMFNSFTLREGGENRRNKEKCQRGKRGLISRRTQVKKGKGERKTPNTLRKEKGMPRKQPTYQNTQKEEEETTRSHVARIEEEKGKKEARGKRLLIPLT